eukprot:COSAG06_NODE_20447_length_795_cov_1.928161_1_plen_177_part_00
MRPSTAATLFGCIALASAAAYAHQTTPPPLRGMGAPSHQRREDAGLLAPKPEPPREEAGGDLWQGPEPEPPPPPPPRVGSQCHVWEYCWKLTIPDTFYFLVILGVGIIGTFYCLNNWCCYEDPALQQARYEKLKAERRAREMQEGLAEQAGNAAASARRAANLPYSEGGQARPYSS